ncbi:MAG: c-type cytochrome [Acidobacteria bacterium]|nr:c-type cytochrome [Acidobacteriota bacterium]
MMRTAWVLLAVGIVATSASGRATEYASPAPAPTFTKDVAPIFFESCASCHRPGEVAPMPLLSYQDARPWSKAIRQKVLSREMPPWHADPQYGKFRNDRSLTRQQIAAIVAWVDAGSPKGDDADLPAPPTFIPGWQNGEPDYIIDMPIEYELQAEGEIPEQNFYVKIPFAEDRFAEVLEIRPSNPAVVHHGGAHLVDLPAGHTVVNGRAIGPDGKEIASLRFSRRGQPSLVELAGSQKLISFVPGRGLERHRPGVAKRLPAGKYIQFAMHYQPTGKPEKDRTRLGIWFSRTPVTHEVLTMQAGNPLATSSVREPIYIAEGKPVPLVNGRPDTPNIPPYAENWSLTGVTAITEPITLYGMSPHMHLRGKDLKWVLTLPDGREEVLLSVPKYDFNWQIHYELETPIKIPAGSKITGIAHYDNSIRNRYNPGPDKEVFWSEQSWDEMYQAFMEVTIDSQDLTKRRAIATQPQQKQ